MKHWPVVVLMVLAVASVVLPYRFGMFWLMAPALVLGALALTGVVRDYSDDGEEPVGRGSVLTEHGVKLLVVSGVLCMVSIIGGMRSCNAQPDRASLRDYAGENEGTKDFIRDRAKPRRLPLRAEESPRPPAAAVAEEKP